MLFEVVSRVLAPIVERSVLMYRLPGLMRTVAMALPCHSNQYVAHYAIRGGRSASSSSCGAFFVYLYYAASVAIWYFGAAHYAFRGGYSSNGSYCGVFFVTLYNHTSIESWTGGAALLIMLFAVVVLSMVLFVGYSLLMSRILGFMIIGALALI